MYGLNQVQIIGRVGNNAEIRNLPNGSSVANFSVATDEGYRDKKTGQWVDRVEWHRVTTFPARPRRCPEDALPQGPSRLRPGQAADSQVAGQQRQRPLHHRDPHRPRRPGELPRQVAERRRRHPGVGTPPRSRQRLRDRRRSRRAPPADAAEAPRPDPPRRSRNPRRSRPDPRRLPRGSGPSSCRHPSLPIATSARAAAFAPARAAAPHPLRRRRAACRRQEGKEGGE